MTFHREWKVTAFLQKGTNASDRDPLFFQELGTAVEVTRLRTTFKVEKSLKKEANPCEITITNLNEASRAEFTQRPLRVKLEAGTDGVLQHLFIGDIRPGSASEIVGTDWETRLLLGDGARAIQNARINRAYRSGTTMRTILRDVSKSFGLLLPRELEVDRALDAPLAVGETVTGWSADEISRLLAPYGYNWSIQDGRLQILKDGDLAPGEAWLIDEKNGMIGSPKYGAPKKKGKSPNVTVNTHLRPEISPGGRIQLRSRDVQGVFKVIRVGHSGDSHGTSQDSWTTEIEGKPV